MFYNYIIYIYLFITIIFSKGNSFRYAYSILVFSIFFFLIMFLIILDIYISYYL